MMNKKGSALLTVVLISGLIIGIAALVMNLNTQSFKEQNTRAMIQRADSVRQVVATLLADANTCLEGLDGSGPEKGIQFLDAGGTVSNFDLAIASTPAGQRISVVGIYPSGATRLRFDAGVNIPNTSLQVRRVYLANAVAHPTTPNMYTGKVYIDVQSTNTDDLAIAPRPVSELRFEVPPPGTEISSCALIASGSDNQVLCESMGCTYTLKGTISNCYCPIQPVTCSGGRYVSSIVANVPQCSAATITRACSGPNEYLVSLDVNGQPVCAEILICPAGTSQAGAGGPATPPECKCNAAGDIFNGTVCGPPAGLCWSNISYGPANRALYEPAPFHPNGCLHHGSCSPLNATQVTKCEEAQATATRPYTAADEAAATPEVGYTVTCKSTADGECTVAVGGPYTPPPPPPPPPGSCTYMNPSIFDAGNPTTNCYVIGSNVTLNPGDPPDTQYVDHCKDKTMGLITLCSGFQTWYCDAVYGMVVQSQECDGTAQSCSECASSPIGPAARIGTAAECGGPKTTISNGNCRVTTGYLPQCGNCTPPVASVCPAGESISVDNRNIDYDQGCCPPLHYWSNNPFVATAGFCQSVPTCAVAPPLTNCIP